MNDAPVAMPNLLEGINEKWLESRREVILEPELPICDSHHHLFLRPEYTYLMPEFVIDASSGHNIENTVFLEYPSFSRATGPLEMRSVGEAEFVRGVGAMSDSGQFGRTKVAEGFVGRADIMLGARVDAVLEALESAAGGRLRGIRYLAGWDANFTSAYAKPGVYLDDKFREGFARLAVYGLSFDALAYHSQLSDVVSLAQVFPAQPIILNHVGTPIGVGPYAGKRQEELVRWRKGMAELARCDNVTVKLGALASKRAGFGWHERASPPSSLELAEAWRPYVETSIELFGANRCMFESNFPIDKVGCSYAVLWNAFKRLAAQATPEEKAALFRNTAHRIYRMGPTAKHSVS